jgi:ribokinase
MNTALDFLAVGDITTDAFIELRDAWIETDNPEHRQELCMRFGDKSPYESVAVVPAVGNSPNAAVAARRLGLSSAIVTDLGDDDYGKEMLRALRREGVSRKFARVHPGFGSNYHFVLRFKAERTILVKHEEYPYAFPEIEPAPRYLYLSSLAENSLPYHEQIADYLEAHPDCALAFQPGTFQIKLGARRIARLYKRSRLFFCNKEEAKRILSSSPSPSPLSPISPISKNGLKGVAGRNATDEIKELLVGIRDLGPKIAVITDGRNGAFADDGTSVWSIPMFPDPKPPVDRTGAGDSFAATFTAALALGKSIPEALLLAPINSMSVTQEIGAQKGLLTRDRLEKYLADAPKDYAPKKLS